MDKPGAATRPDPDRARRLLGIPDPPQQVTYAERARMDQERRARLERRHITIALDRDTWAWLARSPSAAKVIAAAVERRRHEIERLASNAV